MKKLLVLLSFSWLVFSLNNVNANEVQAQIFYDQHDNPMNLSATTQWIIFSHDKDGGNWVKEALTELDITNLEGRGGIYLADISKMPSLVTKLFAMPKMKKYEFRMALDKTGELSESFPRIDSRVALIKLDSLKITEVIQAKSADEIKAFLTAY